MKVMINIKHKCRIFVPLHNPAPHVRLMWWMMTPWQHHMLSCRHHKCQHISLQIAMAQRLQRMMKITTMLLWNTLTP